MPAVLAGRYRLAELIGRGGTGEVWRGHDLQRDWPVAVKILSPQVADLSMRERFAREARIAARVVHPNVVTVFDVGEHEGRPYLVMELLTGRDLATELAEKGPLGIPAVCRLAGQAAVGLDTAHRAGVVHRDVKPANLHQSADGRLKVVDFGTARSTAEAAMRLTSVGSVIGTAAYLSPEQILGEAGDAASDLYALGCVCYELLCGRPPFVGSATEVIFHHVHSLPDPPRRYRPDIPVELERLVLALLQKDPAVRPASGDVVRQVLDTVARQVMPPVRDTATFPTAPATAVIPATATATLGSPAEPWTAKLLPERLRSRVPGEGAGAAMGLVAALVVAVRWVSASSDPAEPPVSAAPPRPARAPARDVIRAAVTVTGRLAEPGGDPGPGPAPGSEFAVAAVGVGGMADAPVGLQPCRHRPGTPGRHQLQAGPRNSREDRQAGQEDPGGQGRRRSRRAEQARPRTGRSTAKGPARLYGAPHLLPAGLRTHLHLR